MTSELSDRQCPEVDLLGNQEIPTALKNKISILDYIKKGIHIKHNYLKINYIDTESFVDHCINCGSPGLHAVRVPRGESREVEEECSE